MLRERRPSLNKIFSCHGSLENMPKEIIRDLDSSCSLKELRCALTFYKGLFIETSNLRISFDCEVKCGMTQISLKLIDGTEFMHMTCDGSFNTVPEDMQKELIMFLTELCSNAIDCIEKRIPVVEEMKRKDTIKYVICEVLGLLLSISYNIIPNAVFGSMNNTAIAVIRITIALLGIAFLAKALLIIMRWIYKV